MGRGRNEKWAVLQAVRSTTQATWPQPLRHFTAVTKQPVPNPPCHPRSEFPSNTFYEGALQNGITVAERTRPQVRQGTDADPCHACSNQPCRAFRRLT